MAKTVTLSDGVEHEMDLNKISIGEWRDLFKPDAPEDLDLQLLGRVIGLDYEQTRDLGYLDWLRLRNAVRDAATNPLEDPT